MHNSNIEHSRPIKTWAPYALGVVAIAVVWLFYKTGEEKMSPPITQQEEKMSPPITQQEVQEVSPHIIL